MTEKIEKNDKTFLEDGMSTKDIQQTVRYIREYIEKGGSMTIEEKIKKLEIEHSFFHERYPMLFDMCTRKDFNWDNFNYFIKMRENIINDMMTAEDASKEVGKVWFDKYVDVSKLKKK